MTVWLGDPGDAYASTLTDDEVVVMKSRDGRVLGFEILHHDPRAPGAGLTVEATIQPLSAARWR
ncbi:MAG: hypothetical protein HYY05_03205 [Chloroflexi bacterium]|nr:hypothetical protein [Chloroflexota bacterium]